MSPNEGETLASALFRVEAEGFNCVNFSEFVFVPRPSEDFVGTDYRRRMLTYYFFEPARPRLMRAWKRGVEGENISTGGHWVVGKDVRIYPVDFILRHYICLSLEDACAKYLTRRYADKEVNDMGWHGNRLNLNRDRLLMKEAEGLRRLSAWDSRAFDRSAPMKKHYWEWEE